MAHFPLCPGSTLSTDLKPTDQDATHLFVISHGILSSYRLLDPLIERIKDDCRQRGIRAAFWAPELPWAGTRGSLFGFGDLNAEIEKMRQDMDQVWGAHDYDVVTFVGHSMGGLFLRALYLAGQDKAVVSDKRHWFDPQPGDRMVLLAAINRGAGATRLMPWHKAFGAHVMTRVLTALEGVAPHLVNTVRRDAPFIARLRMRWVSAIEDLNRLTVVQLLGSQDDVVGPNDTLDLVTGGNFYYLDVPHTGHRNILDVWPNGSHDTQTQTRWRVLQQAFFECPDALKAQEIRPWGLKRPDDPAEEQAVTDVVFVIHGIRDPGHWTDKVARKIWKMGHTKGARFERVAESYGYFGMGPFLFPGYRRAKVNWLIERYVKARAQFPDARFHFVGHSHGTYVFAKMLETMPDCRFDNVVFVGSVVRRGFEWRALQDKGQVKRLLNFVATSDLVVAIFPSMFDTWNVQDLGGGGHLGFSDSDATRDLHSINYAVGGHSAAREEDMWDAIARFVIGTRGDPLPAPLADLQTKGSEVLGRLENRRRGMMAGLATVLNPLAILIYAALAVLVLGIVPWALVTWVWPWIADKLVPLPLGSGRGTLAALTVVSGLIFWRSQRKYGRRLGLVRSWIAAGVFAATAWGIWSWVPTLDAVAGGEAGTAAMTLNAVASTLVVVAWLLFVRWVLRKV